MAFRSGNLSIDRAIASINVVGRDQLLAMRDAIKYWSEKVLVRHFQRGNANRYGWPRLDPKYVKRKLKKWGDRPQLVASGLLKQRATTTAKVRIENKKRISVKFRVPEYGIHQIRKGRDWTAMNKREFRDHKRIYKYNLQKRRQKTNRKR